MTNDLITTDILRQRIFTIRGKRVMFDRDLAQLYGVELKRLNEAVKRNIKRFPSNFMFQLSQDEWDNLRSQFATTNANISKVRYLPYVFTEHGVTMLASVLNSDRAIDISIQIVETFIALRQYALETKELSQRISDIEKYIIGYCEDNEKDKEEIYKALDLLMERTKPSRIGFNTSKGDKGNGHK